jgi:hypothetical protein
MVKMSAPERFPQVTVAMPAEDTDGNMPMEQLPRLALPLMRKPMLVVPPEPKLASCRVVPLGARRANSAAVSAAVQSSPRASATCDCCAIPCKELVTPAQRARNKVFL